ncbi:restriction endonuclease subunit S [Qipengyuania citrea]|jgi:type I restriction enzyme S subunit|uniref:Restriction endonuclease subunit S n=1 Tax=Qipengyuania citrea TaxID=225971 RepID=A0ABY4U5L3_9SPHN|nr:restriction endonuclease subunit S [Qipengyuania citrea]USA61398.1 restriction endonuclease subunit S [Qipengyuania citrea]
MIPEGWREATAEELCSRISVGIVIKPTQYYVDEEQGVRAFRSANIGEGFVRDSEWIHISEDGHAKNKKSALKANDILIVRTGYPGTACLLPPEYEGSNCIDIIFARPDPEQVVPAYLCTFTNSEYGKKQVLDGSGGLAQQHFNVGAYKKLKLPLPPLFEQRRIAETLETWDRASETVEALIANARAQKQALMQQLLPKGTTRPKKRLPGFSGEWRKLQIGDVAKEVSERAGDEADYPVLSCSKYDGMVESLSYFKKKVYSDDTSNYKVMRRGTFGFPSNHIEEGSIGYQDLFDAGIVSPIYCVFAADKTVDDGFLYKLLKTDRYRQIFAAATNASVDRRGSLRWKEFAKITLLLPPVEEQQAISEAVNSIAATEAACEAQLTALRQEKAALMQQLLTGKRRVKLSEREVA